jgi:LmbE family N-acetylglucosaminyl deacetylase
LRRKTILLDILIIAAHPDDEVLGMGATIRKLVKKKKKIHLCVVTEGATAQYKDDKMIKIRKESCIKAGKILGISTFNFLGFPDMKLDSIPQLEINIELEKMIKKFNPEIVYTTPNNDLNKDHQLVFESTIIATRPHSSKVKTVISYEIPGLVKEPFEPNLYEEITKEFSYKIKAFKKYTSEIQKYPSPRSLENLENWANVRGMESNTKKAESFKIIKTIST